MSKNDTKQPKVRKTPLRDSITGAREASQVKFPVIEGIRRCAAILGVPPGILSALKTSGADGFIRGDRVDTAKVIPLLFARLINDSHFPVGCASWKDAGEKFRALNEKLEFEKAEGLLIPAVEVQQQAAQAGALFMNELERLEREGPPAWAGLPITELAKVYKTEIERTRTTLKQKMEKIGK